MLSCYPSQTGLGGDSEGQVTSTKCTFLSLHFLNERKMKRRMDEEIFLDQNRHKNELNVNIVFIYLLEI